MRKSIEKSDKIRHIRLNKMKLLEKEFRKKRWQSNMNTMRNRDTSKAISIKVIIEFKKDDRRSKNKIDKMYLNTLIKIYMTHLQENLLPSSTANNNLKINTCLLYTSPSPRDLSTSRMPSSA